MRSTSGKGGITSYSLASRISWHIVMSSVLRGPPSAFQDWSNFTARMISLRRLSVLRSRRDDLDAMRGGRDSNVSKAWIQHIRDREICRIRLQTYTNRIVRCLSLYVWNVWSWQPTVSSLMSSSTDEIKCWRILKKTSSGRSSKPFILKDKQA